MNILVTEANSGVIWAEWFHVCNAQARCVYSMCAHPHARVCTRSFQKKGPQIENILQVERKQVQYFSLLIRGPKNGYPLHTHQSFQTRSPAYFWPQVYDFKWCHSLRNEQVPLEKRVLQSTLIHLFLISRKDKNINEEMVLSWRSEVFHGALHLSVTVCISIRFVQAEMGWDSVGEARLSAGLREPTLSDSSCLTVPAPSHF